MIEYTNGQFGAIHPATELMEHMRTKMDELDEIRAIHFGTPAELQEVRLNRSGIVEVNERLSSIERELDSLKPKGLVKVYQPEDIP
jgi:uncharacterized protein Yka (UPF0111/DUF47 family)